MSKQNGKLLKAVTSGTIFGELLDVYRLEDGTILASQRGMVKALTAKKDGENGGTDTGSLDRYLARLPNGYLDITVGPKTFIMPQGGTASGVPIETVSAILQAFALAYQDGALHHTLLTDKPRSYLSTQLDIAVALAEESISEKQWRRKMRRYYRKDKATLTGQLALDS